jgi:hypothetical protein
LEQKTQYTGFFVLIRTNNPVYWVVWAWELGRASLMLAPQAPKLGDWPQGDGF